MFHGTDLYYVLICKLLSLLNTYIYTRIYSFYLWSISEPIRNEAPTININENPGNVDSIIIETFNHYDIRTIQSFRQSSCFASKQTLVLGNFCHSLGSSCGRVKKLKKWKDRIHSAWQLAISSTEVNFQLLQERKSDELKLKDEVSTVSD